MFSVADMAEAKELIVLTCAVNHLGQYYANELATHQTLKNLDAFSDRLDRAHDLLRKSGSCRCKDAATVAEMKRPMPRPACPTACSRCDGTGDDPDNLDCVCDCCGGSGREN